MLNYPFPKSLPILLLLAVLHAPALYAQDEDLTILDDWLIHADARNTLYRDLNRRAQALLDERRRRIEGIASLADWQAYQQEVRDKLAEVVGPFPERTPLNAQVTGRIERERFVVEKVVYESRPGFYVTAALFMPKEREGRAPAILYCSGHTENGFRSEVYQTMILNLVLKGFVVLAFDPFGQGERQAYLDEQGVSRVGGPTKQHSYPGAQLFVMGQSLANYVIWDGMRGVDYLVSRPEVDPRRIGVVGRSGGGTQAAYIAAFDERIAAAAPEAYITSFGRLMASIGPQDTEQNFFHGIAAGLDHADLLLVRAPKPALMITTTRDFFSIQGARESFREAHRIYAALGAPEAFAMVEDDAPHASTRANREAMYDFFLRRLLAKGSSKEEDVQLFSPETLQVTPTGQVSTSYDGETVFSLMQQDASGRHPASPDLSTLRGMIREIAGYRHVSGTVEALFAGRFQRDGYAIERYIVSGDGDYAMPVLVFIPWPAGKHPVVLYLHPEGKAASAGIGGVIEKLVHAECMVVAPDLPGIGELGGGDFRGDAYMDGVSLNTWFAGVLTGQSISGLQASDISRTAAFALTHPAAGSSGLTAIAYGPAADPLLHAAAMDTTIRAVAVIGSILSYEQLVANEHYAPELMPSVVAGAWPRYDLIDVAASLAPRPLAIVHPIDSEKEAAPAPLVDRISATVRAVYSETGTAAALEIHAVEQPWGLEAWVKRVAGPAQPSEGDGRK